MTCRVCTESRAGAQTEPLTSRELAGGTPLGTWWQECCRQKLLCCQRQTDLRSCLETVSQDFFRRNYSSGRPRPLGAGGQSPAGPRPGHSSPSGAARPGALAWPLVSEPRGSCPSSLEACKEIQCFARKYPATDRGALCRGPAGAGGSQRVRPRASGAASTSRASVGVSGRGLVAVSLPAGGVWKVQERGACLLNPHTAPMGSKSSVPAVCPETLYVTSACSHSPRKPGGRQGLTSSFPASAEAQRQKERHVSTAGPGHDGARHGVCRSRPVAGRGF